MISMLECRQGGARQEGTSETQRQEMPFQGRVGILCSVVSTVVHFIEPLQMELFVDWLSRITVKITPVSV